jgi:hypothetical protein
MLPDERCRARQNRRDKTMRELFLCMGIVCLGLIWLANLLPVLP